jgi:hypothetical protein
MPPCKTPSSNYMFGFDILLHIFILSLIISLFYFLHVVDLSTRLFKLHISELIDNEMVGAIKKADKEKKIKNILKKFDLDGISNYYSKPNKQTENQNEWLKGITITLIVVLFLFIIGFYFVTRNFCSKVPIGHMIKTNIIVFIAVGLVEILFFLNIGKKYIPAKPSLLMQSFIDSVEKVL